MQKMTMLFLKNALLTFLVIITVAAACEKSDNTPPPERYNPTAADSARCAHMDTSIDAISYYYNLCLRSPWPTELPEVEVGGERILAAWINDTLTFVAENPQESPSFNIKLTAYEDGRIILEGQRATWQDIDSTRLSFVAAFYADGEIQRAWFRISYHELSGDYEADLNQSIIAFTEHDNYASGTFDLVLVDSTTNKRITLTAGRFHAPFSRG